MRLPCAIAQPGRARSPPCVLAPAPLAARAQPAPELAAGDPGASCRPSQDLLARGGRRVRRPAAEPLDRRCFDEIIARLEALRRAGHAAAARQARSWRRPTSYAARAYFSIGLQEKASESFRRWSSSSPQHALTQGEGLAQDRRLFNSVKKALVGYLAVSSRAGRGEGDALNRRVPQSSASPTSSRSRCWPASTRSRSRATATGPRRARSASRPRPPRRCEVDLLTRALASACSWSPSRRASRSGWTASCARPRRAPWPPSSTRPRARKGLDPARAAARVEIANLSLGSHVVELRRKCYEAREAHARDPGAPGLRPPTRSGSRTRSPRCSSRSDPPGARIFLDGEALGVTPAELDGVCSGKHRASR